MPLSCSISWRSWGVGSRWPMATLGDSTHHPRQRYCRRHRCHHSPCFSKLSSWQVSPSTKYLRSLRYWHRWLHVSPYHRHYSHSERRLDCYALQRFSFHSSDRKTPTVVPRYSCLSRQARMSPVLHRLAYLDLLRSSTSSCPCLDWHFGVTRALDLRLGLAMVELFRTWFA